MTIKGKDAEIGDRIKIKLPKEEIEGILLESPQAGIVLIKLDSGYNLGFDRSNILNISVLKKAEVKEKKIINFELSHKKPVIDLIMTGGTISSSLDSKTGAVKWLTSPEEFFKYYPEIFELADVRIINPFMKSSENMESTDWQKLAKIVVKSLNDDSVRGVILTHGTDFLHYTGAALSFMIKNLNKPVVLTYSQRSSDRASSDAKLNLYCAAKIALSDIAEVTLVGHGSSSDDFCYAFLANKTRKMHTSRRDAFQSINSRPIAKITYDSIDILSNYNKRKLGRDAKAELDNSFEEKVALIKFYPGQDPEILKYYFKEGYKGIVIEMSGLGHVITEGNKNWIPIIRELIKKGMVICSSPQTIYGRLDPLVYSPGRELEEAGVIYLKDILSETAFVKLGWILGKFANKEIKKEEIKELLLKNTSKEFNDRIAEEFV